MKSSALSAADKRIEEIELKLQKERYRRKRLVAVERNKQAKAERALDTRQKLLIGAYVLSRSGLSATEFAQSDSGFSAWLSRDHDRVAFGLPTLSATPSSHSEGNGHA